MRGREGKTLSLLRVLSVLCIFCTLSCVNNPLGQHNLMVVLDLSTSMDVSTPSGKTRLEQTQKSICDFLDNDIGSNFNIGFRFFSGGTTKLVPLGPKKENLQKIKSLVMSQNSIGGTNFRSILSELPKDFAGMSGKNYVMIAGDGQYGNVCPEVEACKRQIETYGKVKGISVGIDLDPREHINQKEIATCFTSAGEEPVFTHVKTFDFGNLALEFFRIRYAMLLLFRIIAFCICVGLSLVLSEIIREITRKIGVNPMHASLVGTLILPFLLFAAFQYYLSEVAGEYINLVVGVLFVLTLLLAWMGSRRKDIKPPKRYDGEIDW